VHKALNWRRSKKPIDISILIVSKQGLYDESDDGLRLRARMSSSQLVSSKREQVRRRLGGMVVARRSWSGGNL
jgi:hypothetical protein